MSERILRKRLIRVAHSLPPRSLERRQLLALLTEDAGMPKEAGKDTADFATWAYNAANGDAKSAREVEAFIVGIGKNTSAPRTKRTGPRWQVGDMVRIDASKHKDSATIEFYKPYHGQIGTVTVAGGHRGDPITVRMERGGTVEFPNAEQARGVGVMKYSPPFDMTGYGPIEMVYMAGGKVKDEQKLIVESYLARARPGETRAANYYSGYVFSASTGKNGYYFTMLPQQRIHFDPALAHTYEWRTFNPNVGQVVYLGRLGKRPSGWKDELDNMRAGAV